MNCMKNVFPLSELKKGSFARVWLEDKESLTAKLNVMKENNIAGVACWKLGLDSKEAWEAIGAYLK